MKKYLILLLSFMLLIVPTTANTPTSSYNNVLVKQADYNCVPASIEMIYRLYGESDISQYDIRKSIGYDGVVYVNDVKKYLDENFEYDIKDVCCIDSLENSFGEYPILMLVDQKKLSWRNYNGHAIVSVGNVKLSEDKVNKYIDVLDPDYGIYTYNVITLYKAIESWNDEIYIIKGIKQK